MCEIYDNPSILISAIRVMAKEKNETVEKIYKEMMTLCIHFLQFQYNYIKKSDKEQFDLRPIRNEMIVQIFRELKEINRYSGRIIFAFEMPAQLRPFERGNRIDKAVHNIVDVFRFLNSSEVTEKLRECI